MDNIAAKLAYSPTEAAKISPIGLTKIYELMNTGQLRYKTVAGRRVIPASELTRLFCELDQNQDEAA